MSEHQLLQEGHSEIIEKKSRFIGRALPIESEQQAQEILKEIRKQYYDARHVCYAFQVDQITRSSDDGEPSGTAGRPILDMIGYAGLKNVLVVVTRYFGGVLLGTGGLTRAYGQTAKEAIEAAPQMEILSGRKIDLVCDYNDYGKVDYLVRQKNIPVHSSDFGAEVTFSVMLEEENYEAFVKEVTDLTGGRTKIDAGNPLKYGLVGAEVRLL
ncbi:MAG: YigZ family protein [Lachnospiraceae bacterium]|nr:YigZ family protein [Lachnospiraceae bacterium]MBQ5484335.1 YigZ family protein [Lachnospiraceae bacterium]